MRVAVIGATGLIGRHVCAALAGRGDAVRAVSRRGEQVVPGSEPVRWLGPPETFPTAELGGVDAVVNLAGAPIADRRWTEQRKRDLRSSRVELTQALVATMAAADPGPGILVSASAAGYYGSREEPLDEASPPGDDFLARVCVDWEAAARGAEDTGARVVLMRMGLVLAKEADLVRKLTQAARLLAGGPLGGGRQWFPWIHVEDVVGIILWALDREEVAGPVNVTAPGPVRQGDLAAALRTRLGRPFGLPTPAFAVRLALGEAADVVLAGQRPLPRAALDAGYRFRYPELEPALRDVVG